MMKKFTFLFAIISIAYSSSAQFEKLTDSKYYMIIKPMMGSLSGSSDFASGINPNLTLESRGLLWGVDWTSTRWAEVDECFVPKIQVPIKFRYMRAGNMKGLKTSDGSYFPDEARVDPKDKPWAPFNYLDFSIDFYYSLYSFKAGNVIITPRLGLDIDIARHDYDLDVSTYLGKEGTIDNLQGVINSSYSPYYSYTFWEDLYGINLGSYFNIGRRVFIDAGWEYLPGRLMTKAIKNSINTNWDGAAGTAESKSTKLRKITIEAHYRIISWFSVFAKYENSKYQFEGPTFTGDQKYYQKYSNLMFGITLGGPKLDL